MSRPRLKPSWPAISLVGGLLLCGCGNTTPGATSTGGTESEAGTEGSAASGEGQDSESGSGEGEVTTAPSTSTDTSAETDTGDTGDTGMPPDEPLRFIVLGDGGEGNETQYQVANAVEMVCAERGCEFALYLGDNIYDAGVDAIDDMQFITKFEEPYADIDFPFYITLGNHDYGGFIGGVFANEWEKAGYEIGYTDYSDKWTLPAKWYQFSWKNARFMSLDTARLMFDYETEQQREWIGNATAGATQEWKIAFGHHPYISNGSHGNAGNYEGLPWPDTVSGGDVKDFMDQELCYRVDVYFSGHDHNRQWLEPTCGVEFIVSGTAAKTTGLVGRDDNPTYFEDDSKAGFMWVEIDGPTMTGAFFDLDGNLDFERTFTK